MTTFTAQLCKCNNCDAIMFDENPGEQPAIEIPDNAIIIDMIRISDPEWPDSPECDFWACPNCLTDGYLRDIENEDEI